MRSNGRRKMPPSDAAIQTPEEIMEAVRNKKRIPAWTTTEHNSSVWDSAADGCCGQGYGELVPPWMDWVESGIEFFGCEGEAGRSVIGRALMLQHNFIQQLPPEAITEARDYVKLHEEFFESLLKEQVLSLADPAAPPGLTQSESQDESTCSGTSSAASSSVSSFSIASDGLTLGSESLSSIKTQKRRRPLKMQKRSPRMKSRTRIAPIEAYNKKYNPANANAISLEDIVMKDIREPPEFMHPRCVLQKDKGKGNPLGSSISAEGREACLEKLREKMSIVVQVSGEERKSSTDMKRRIAKISAHTPTYIETRSIIELRLGFLTMQYGLLLQWDYQKTGKVVFIVLRKMCHDSFYTKIPDIPHQETMTTTITRRRLEVPPLVIRNVIGNHAIYQRTQGTEVVLVDPPYRVPQPEVFAPSILTVDIKSITGLSKKSRWTVSMTFNGHTEVSSLHYNPDKRIFEAVQTSMKWEMMPVSSFDLAGLEIRLFEESKRRNARSRLATTMTLPLGGLVAQPSTSQATSWQLTMPFTHDPNADLTISLCHQSDYAHWLYKELDARRKEEVSGFVWKAPFRKRPSRKERKNEEKHAPDEDVWDWLCGICFKEYYLP